MNREFPVEKGFQVVVFFLMDFWHDFLKGQMVKKGIINEKLLTPEELDSASSEDKIKDAIHDGNDFVFSIVCGDPAGPGKYFEEIVEKSTKISPKKQHQGWIVKEELLFQFTIDFCDFFNRKFEEYGEKCKRKNSLSFAINWLEDMRKHPEKHKTEWDMWEKTIEYVYSPGNKHLIF